MIPPADDEPAASQTIVCILSTITSDGGLERGGALLLRLAFGFPSSFDSKGKGEAYIAFAIVSAMTSASVSHHNSNSGSSIPSRNALDAI